jgi:hypothetical protein
MVEDVNPTSFEVKYLFGAIPEIKQSSVRIQFGIAYNFNGFFNYYNQNMTFFDSKCRKCENGQLDVELVRK